MAHWRRQYRPPDRIQGGVHAILASIAVAVYFAFLAVFFWAMFATQAKAETCQPGQSEHLAALAAELKIKPSNPGHIAVMTDCQGRQYDMVKLLLEAVRKVKERK